MQTPHRKEVGHSEPCEVTVLVHCIIMLLKVEHEVCKDHPCLNTRGSTCFPYLCHNISQHMIALMTIQPFSEDSIVLCHYLLCVIVSWDALTLTSSPEL